MKTKQLIERKLPFSDKYIYLGIERGKILDGQFCTCDNCGILITNMVKVASNTTGKRFTIGTDCAETLSKAKCLFNNGSQTDFYVDIYAYNLTARFVTEINAGCSIESNNGMQCSLINRKGKVMQAYNHDLAKFFPEITIPMQD